MPQPQLSPPNPKKRRASPQAGTGPTMTTSGTTAAAGEVALDHGPGAPEAPPKKKGRTNTPWTAEEEQRLKTMRDAGRSWSEIAKVHHCRIHRCHWTCC
jgi:hypothetical protein